MEKDGFGPSDDGRLSYCDALSGEVVEFNSASDCKRSAAEGIPAGSW